MQLSLLINYGFWFCSLYASSSCLETSGRSQSGADIPHVLIVFLAQLSQNNFQCALKRSKKTELKRDDDSSGGDNYL